MEAYDGKHKLTFSSEFARQETPAEASRWADAQLTRYFVQVEVEFGPILSITYNILRGKSKVFLVNEIRISWVAQNLSK